MEKINKKELIIGIVLQLLIIVFMFVPFYKGVSFNCSTSLSNSNEYLTTKYYSMVNSVVGIIFLVIDIIILIDLLFNYKVVSKRLSIKQISFKKIIILFLLTIPSIFWMDIFVEMENIGYSSIRGCSLVLTRYFTGHIYAIILLIFLIYTIKIVHNHTKR